MKAQLLALSACWFPLGAAARGNHARAQFVPSTVLSLRGGSIADATTETPLGSVVGAAVDKIPVLKLQLAGKLLPAIKASFAQTENGAFAVSSSFDKTMLTDWVIIGALWAASEPAAKGLNKLQNMFRARTEHSIVKFEKTLAWALSQAFTGLAKILMVLYFSDLTLLWLEAFRIPVRKDLPQILATLAKPIWVGYLISNVKMWILGTLPGQLEGKPTHVTGRKLVYDRLLDFTIGTASVIAALEFMSLEIGVALTSLLAVSGLSSVMVALALKEPLSHLVHGLMVTFSDKFRPGDEIQVGDLSGFVTKMGWFDTQIRKYDESTVIIPNGKIMGVPITNGSRITWGQYKTDLRLRYEDLDKVEAVVDAIKKALAALAPQIVLPPVRNIWVHFRSFEKDHISLTVDCKTRAPGGSTKYYEIRERANLAIAKAVRENGAEFAIPVARKIDDKGKKTEIVGAKVAAQ